MLNITDIQLARRLSLHDAVIMKTETSTAFPAYPSGDRRKHPVSWVSRESFQNLRSFGGLELCPRGYRVNSSLAKRFTGKGDHADQHRDIEEREIYIESGVKRPARLNRALTALDRLSRRRNKFGKPLISKAEYEAGHHIAKDYALSGHGLIATQNYMSAGEDKTGYAGGLEERYAMRVDAMRRLNSARKAMGPGLDKAVIAVCCLDQSLDQVERAENWAVKSGLTILKMGLQRLVKFYGTDV